MARAVEYVLWEEDFLTYNFQITSQKSIDFPDFVASNGIRIKTCVVPEWAVDRSDNFYLRGTNTAANDRVLKIPKSKWPKSEKALKEFNDKYSTEPEKWSIGDLLVGECPCTPAKTITFEVTAPGSFKLLTPFLTWTVGSIQNSFRNKEYVDLADIAEVFAYDIRRSFTNWKRVPKSEPRMDVYTFSKEVYNCEVTASEIRITRKPKPSRYTFELTIEERQNVPSWMEKLVV